MRAFEVAPVAPFQHERMRPVLEARGQDADKLEDNAERFIFY